MVNTSWLRTVVHIGVSIPWFKYTVELHSLDIAPRAQWALSRVYQSSRTIILSSPFSLHKNNMHRLESTKKKVWYCLMTLMTLQLCFILLAWIPSIPNFGCFKYENAWGFANLQKPSAFIDLCAQGWEFVTWFTNYSQIYSWIMVWMNNNYLIQSNFWG